MLSLFNARTNRHTEVMETLGKTKEMFEDFKVSMSSYDTALYRLNDYVTEFVSNKDINIKIPSERYVEVAPGVFDRLVLNVNDIKYEWENDYKNVLDELNFKDHFVVFVKFENGAKFKMHHHDTKEIIHCLKGSYIANFKLDSNDFDIEIIREGDRQFIDAKEPHMFYPLEDGVALIELSKK